MPGLLMTRAACGDSSRESELKSQTPLDRAVDGWRKDQVAPAYDALKRDPSRAIAISNVRKRLAAVHKTASSRKLRK